MKTKGAYILRETTGTSGLEQTLRDAVALLARHECAHLVAGGMAVQEHGYFRVTLDVDIIVADVMDAVELLTADLTEPFERMPRCDDSVKDKRNGVVVHLLPAEQSFNASCQIPFPMPHEISDEPQFVSLDKLISLKLDSWVHSPTRRLKDKADVIELIKLLRLPRDLPVDEPIRAVYAETWDALAAER